MVNDRLKGDPMNFYCKLSKKKVYTFIVDRLWDHVCVKYLITVNEYAAVVLWSMTRPSIKYFVN